MTKIKCVIAAGGLGTRLKDYKNNNLTKMLLEVNGVPMINRQIMQLKNWGFEDFIIITNPEFEIITREIVNKEFPNLNIDYSIQEKPKGISHALLQAKPYIKDENIIVFVLGDNFFEKDPFINKRINFERFTNGSYVFTYEVSNPSDFGVAVIENNSVVSIEEKPKIPKSNKAIIGLYVYDNTVIRKIESLEPSERGEYEITDLNNLYIAEGSCKHINIDGWWIDAGTPERIEELETKLT